MGICSLTLEDLKIKVRLGVTAKERSKKQTVILHIKIGFPKTPLACQTGKISDTICYDKLSKKIKKFCDDKKFKLIEELGMQLFNIIKNNIYKNCQLKLRIVKKPSILGLKHSVFEIKNDKLFLSS